MQTAKILCLPAPVIFHKLKFLLAKFLQFDIFKFVLSRQENPVFRVGRAAAAAVLLLAATEVVANAQTVHSSNMFTVGHLSLLTDISRASLITLFPPTDPKLEVLPFINDQKEERMRIVFPKGAQNQNVGLLYFAPDANELIKTGVSFASFHPQQDDERFVQDEKGLVMDVGLAREDGSNFYKFFVNLRVNGQLQGLYLGKTLIDPKKPGYFNFNWDHFDYIFDLQHNGKPVEGELIFPKRVW